MTPRRSFPARPIAVPLSRIPTASPRAFEPPGAAVPVRSASRTAERPRERELVTVGVREVEEALAPRRVARVGRRPESGGERPRVEPVDVGDVEDRPAPRRGVEAGPELEVQEL